MKGYFLLSLLAVSLFLTGCNTVKGIGQDISGTASWTQEKMSGGSAKSSDADYVQNPPQFPKSN